MRIGLFATVVLAACLVNPRAVRAADPTGAGGGGAEVKSSQPTSTAKAADKKKARKERSKLDLVVTALPASLLVDAEGDKFEVNGARMSNVYMMPTIAAGPGVELGDFYVDLLGGVGMIVNDSFQSFLLEAVVSATYSFSDSFHMGPRMGLVYFTDPNYSEDDNVEFDSALGYLIGLQFSMGDRIQYVVSVDLLKMSMDAKAAEGVATSDSTLDITGLTFQFGVRGEF